MQENANVLESLELGGSSKTKIFRTDLYAAFFPLIYFGVEREMLISYEKYQSYFSPMGIFNEKKRKSATFFYLNRKEKFRQKLVLRLFIHHSQIISFNKYFAKY